MASSPPRPGSGGAAGPRANPFQLAAAEGGEDATPAGSPRAGAAGGGGPQPAPMATSPAAASSVPPPAVTAAAPVAAAGAAAAAAEAAAAAAPGPAADPLAAFRQNLYELDDDQDLVALSAAPAQPPRAAGLASQQPPAAAVAAAAAGPSPGFGDLVDIDLDVISTPPAASGLTGVLTGGGASLQPLAPKQQAPQPPPARPGGGGAQRPLSPPAAAAGRPQSAAAAAAAPVAPASAAALGGRGLGEWDEDSSHPLDYNPAAGGGSGGGAGGGGGGGGRRGEAVVGVHGEAPAPGDDEVRLVQVQTFGGEGVPSRWRRLMRRLGVRRKRPQGSFPSNELVTARYNVLSFLPVNLLQQFKRVANLYFLALVLLQAIPGLSPVPWWGTLFPLAVVLTVNAVKEGFDDYWRHVSDAEVNSRLVTLLREDGDAAIAWRTVQVGDLLRLHNGDDVPADLVLLASSDPEGLCYVETANLDGETNLKVKTAHTATAAFDCAESFSRAGYFTIEAEAPNPRLYSFEGAICCWDVPPTSLGVFNAAAGGGAALRSPPPSGGGAGPRGRPMGAGIWGQQVGLVSRDPLDANNLLLRGSKLRKTDWVIGAVVFTGPDTKVVRNMLPAPRKVTRLERSMNAVVVMTLCVLGALAVLLAVASQIWDAVHRPSRHWYLRRPGAWPELAPGIPGFLVQFVRFLILMAQAVPISLYVTLETVKVAQCKLLYDRDREMYWAAEDVPFSSRTTTLNEELGQVDYVLSDKTGTLTQNVMGFVLASVGGKLYGQTPGQTGETAGFMAPQGSVADVPNNTPHTLALDKRLRAAVESEGRSRRRGAFASLTGGGLTGGGGGAAAVDFLLALALCNTVVPTATEGGTLLYQAASPDEEALVAAAAYLGVKLVARSGAAAEVEIGGELLRYEILSVLEFSSDRKRMSVAVRGPVRGTRVTRAGDTADAAGDNEAGRQVLLITKGADNVVLERLAPAQPLLPATAGHLAEMSAAGLRTLVVAAKAVPAAEYEAWAADYKAAASSLEGRDAKVAACCERVERGLTLLGATAVEDKLQDGVPEAVAGLKAAGIKVWVLTGDKMETAVSIAHTCRLLNSQMAVLRLREDDLRSGRGPPEISDLDLRSSLLLRATTAAAARAGRGLAARAARLLGLTDPSAPAGGNGSVSSAGGAGVGLLPVVVGAGSGAAAAAAAGGAPLSSLDPAARALAAARAAVTSGRLAPSSSAAAAAANGGGGGGSGAVAAATGVGLVIDGAALALALGPTQEAEFLALCRECAAVVCCRVSPMQKAQVARLLKRAAGAVTLAIGDGANDVSMIQAAHIGVGISGREGRAAAQAADFAFGQFRFLPRLLLVHGRQSYLRCCEVVLYAFYKNMAYVSCFVYYTFYSGFSAQSVFFSIYIATFNAVWAALPTIAFGIFEQDVSPAAALAHPALYSETRTQGHAAFLRAWAAWIALAAWHGVCAFFIPLHALGYGAMTGAGGGASVYLLGTAVMTAVLIIVTLRVAIRTQHWTKVNHAVIWGSLGLWFPFLGILAALCASSPDVLSPLCGLGAGLLGAPAFWAAAVVAAPAAALLADFSVATFQRQAAPRASQVLQEMEKLAAKAAAGGGAAAAAPAGLPRRPSSFAAALAGARAFADRFDAWGASTAARLGFAPSGSAAAASVLAEEEPRTLGGVAAAEWGSGGFNPLGALGGGFGRLALSPAWAGNYVAAAPEVLAQSHTKRQAKVNRRGPRGAAVQQQQQQTGARPPVFGGGSGGAAATAAGAFSLEGGGAGAGGSSYAAAAPPRGARRGSSSGGGAGSIAMGQLPVGGGSGQRPPSAAPSDRDAIL